jgi:hypothetical protein
VSDLNTEAFSKELFELDTTIRYIAVVDDEYRILVSDQREGVRSLTPDEMERNFFSIFPRIVVDTVEKLAPFLGPMNGMTVHYEKALLVFYHFKDLTVAISFQPEVGTPFYNRLTAVFKKLAEKYLT